MKRYIVELLHRYIGLTARTEWQKVASYVQFKRGNIEQPTSNIEHPMNWSPEWHWTLGVGCSMFEVSFPNGHRHE